jgi:hypothetical protein
MGYFQVENQTKEVRFVTTQTPGTKTIGRMELERVVVLRGRGC